MPRLSVQVRKKQSLAHIQEAPTTQMNVDERDDGKLDQFTVTERLPGVNGP